MTKDGSGRLARTKTIRQTVTFKASPRDVYDMLMNSKKHRSLSGQRAKISAKVGGAFTAWGRHISGFNLALRPGRKIVQAWRARDWWPDHYSVVTFDLAAFKGGTRLTFTQIGVPPHRYPGHDRGWVDAYWTPMKEIFARGSRSARTDAAIRDAKQRIRRGQV